METAYPGTRPETATESSGPGLHLSLRERFLVALVFALWLVVFAGGILMDTRPFRLAISAGGVAALEELEDPASLTALHEASRAEYGLVVPWIVVLTWFLPVNLALLCALSGMLGAFGNRANLQSDEAPLASRDSSNPYVSALLRGFFIYLIMISGLLLLDDDPFSRPSPGQYIRLAGFLSLFSFVVNYQPQVFAKLLIWAVERIEARGGASKQAQPVDADVRYARETTVEVATVHTRPPQAANGAAPAAPPAVPTLLVTPPDQPGVSA